MATVDIPFKTPQEVQEMIALYERRFKDRYTEKDAWYSHTVHCGPRWRDVPKMHPWPPRQKRGGNRSRYDNHDNRGHRGGWHSDRNRHHDDYYPDDRNQRYRERRRSRSPHYTHHTHSQHTDEYRHDYRSSRSPDHRPSPRRRSPSPWRPRTPPAQGSPVLEAPPTPTGEIPNIPQLPDPVAIDTERKPVAFDIETLGTLGDNEPKAPPTSSDVMDILNIAHGGHTANTLKQTKPKHGGKHLHKTKPNNSKEKSSNSTILQVTHGKSKNVTNSKLFVSQYNLAGDQSDRPKKRTMISDSDSSSDDIDVVTPSANGDNPLTISVDRNLTRRHYEQFENVYSSGNDRTDEKKNPSIPSKIASSSSFTGTSYTSSKSQVFGSSRSGITGRQSALSVLTASMSDTAGFNTSNIQHHSGTSGTGTEKAETGIEQFGIGTGNLEQEVDSFVVQIQRNVLESQSSVPQYSSGFDDVIDTNMHGWSTVGDGCINHGDDLVKSAQILEDSGNLGDDGDGRYVAGPSNKIAVKEKKRKKKKKKAKDDEMKSTLIDTGSKLKLKIRLQ